MRKLFGTYFIVTFLIYFIGLWGTYTLTFEPSNVPTILYQEKSPVSFKLRGSQPFRSRS